MAQGRIECQIFEPKRLVLNGPGGELNSHDSAFHMKRRRAKRLTKDFMTGRDLDESFCGCVHGELIFGSNRGHQGPGQSQPFANVVSIGWLIINELSAPQCLDNRIFIWRRGWCLFKLIPRDPGLTHTSLLRDFEGPECCSDAFPSHVQRGRVYC